MQIKLLANDKEFIDYYEGRNGGAILCSDFVQYCLNVKKENLPKTILVSIGPHEAGELKVRFSGNFNDGWSHPDNIIGWKYSLYNKFGEWIDDMYSPVKEYFFKELKKRNVYELNFDLKIEAQDD